MAGFRLLPGVATLWVERFNALDQLESTGTIDLPITYPRPRLDAVNPNLWAADPSLATVPVQVIDRKTLLGTDTFIARRDYYIKMRDDLWNVSTAGGENATGYFPSFDFNQMPGFPAVLFDYPDDGDCASPFDDSELTPMIPTGAFGASLLLLIALGILARSANSGRHPVHEGQIG